MEEGVVNEIMRDKNIADLFDTSQMVTSISGSGNNWYCGTTKCTHTIRAHGYAEYGPKYEDQILESCRRASEYCDSLQSFLLLHSLGGGTGSGLGSYILESLVRGYSGVSLTFGRKIIFQKCLGLLLQCFHLKMMMW
jgi:tubulin epsilon